MGESPDYVLRSLKGETWPVEQAIGGHALQGEEIGHLRQHAEKGHGGIDGCHTIVGHRVGEPRQIGNFESDTCQRIATKVGVVGLDYGRFGSIAFIKRTYRITLLDILFSQDMDGFAKNKFLGYLL